MSTENNTKTILITGINGYIASNIGLQLLQQGYTVRGTSRSAKTKDQLVSDAFSGFESRYQHHVVPNMTVPGAFDEAVKGVYSIIHTASPISFGLQSLDEFLLPAVNGNLSILNSALTAGPQLASFVLTSSIAAVADKWKNPPDYALTESDWNTSSLSVARENFTPPVAYGASKAAAERALWDWRSTHKPSFACAAICPGVVTGPPVTWPETPEGLNETLKPVWRIYAGEVRDELGNMPMQIGGASYIDVRDVAALHVFAALNPEKADGERYLATNGKAPPQATADILRSRFPEREIIVGEPGKGYVEGSYWFPVGTGESSAVAGKAYRAMGLQEGGFIGFEKSVLDTVGAFEKKWPGWARNLKQ
jgi:nucleoside-diphosphate-sugar epimerase